VSTAAESTRSLYSRFNTQIAAVGAALARIRLSKVPLKVTEYSIVHMYHLHILVFRVFPTPIKNINWRAVERQSKTEHRHHSFTSTLVPISAAPHSITLVS